MNAEGRADRGATGTAVSFAVTRFPVREDTDWPPLEFGEYCDDLAAALTSIGYRVSVEANLAAAAIGARFSEVISAGAPGVRVVHVLSHGFRAPSESVYVVGSDGLHDGTTNIENWLQYVEDFPEVPYTLFLFDLCHGGTASLAPWLRRMLDGSNRAWVIAACRPDEYAYEARFTRASAKVLADLAAGRLDTFESLRYVPLDTVAQAIAREVDALASAAHHYGQQVTGNPLSITTDIRALELPFFPNPRYDSSPLAAARAGSDPAVGPYLDEVLDHAHWRERSAGYGHVTPYARVGCFTGRERQLGELVTWLNASAQTAAPALRLVTGSPGSGKSALLGVLVCAAHPELSGNTMELWAPVFRAEAPSVNTDLAAVHARQRDVPTVLASVARQLSLTLPERDPARSARPGLVLRRPARADPGATGWTADQLREAIAARRDPPVIVVDALDEAADPQALLDGLLLPLLETVRPDGRVAARLLIGVRDGDMLERLRRAAGRTGRLTDLDTVEPAELAEDLRGYIGALLRLSDSYQQTSHQESRRAFAAAVADALAELPTNGGRPEWGAFLVAALYTHHLLARPESVPDPRQAHQIGADVPHTLPRVLELDLAGRSATEPWLRPVLTALAYAMGQGMPLAVLAGLAALWRPDRRAGSAEQIQHSLDRARVYLRQAPDTDGTTIYRLFHQGLADYLRSRGDEGVGPGPRTRMSQVLDALLAPLGPTGARRWQTAQPYLLRYAAQHALQADRLAELITDPDYLVHADAATLIPALDRIGAEHDAAGAGSSAPVGAGSSAPIGSVTSARLGRAVFRTSAHRHHSASPADRRDLLSIDAARWGDRDLASAVHGVGVMGRSAPWWRPAWATGSSVATAHRATLTGHEAPVNAVACADVDGRPVAVTGSDDQMVRIWDLASQRPRGEPLGGHLGPVTAVSHIIVGNRQVAVTAGADGTVRLWDMLAGQLIGDLPAGHTRPVQAIACTWLADGPVAVTCGADGTVRIWDLTGRAAVGAPLLGHGGPVQAVACTSVEGRPVAVTTGVDGTVRSWDLTDLEAVHQPLAGHDGLVTAVACIDIDGRPTAVSTGVDGTVRLWDLTDSRAVGTLWRGHVRPRPVRAVTCAVLDGRPAAVTTGDDQAVRLWDLAAFEPLDGPFAGHTGVVTAVAAHEIAGRPVAVTTGDDTTIRVWDLAPTQPIGAPVAGHMGAVQAAACAVTDRRRVVVTAGADRTVRIWDSDLGQAHGDPLSGHSGPVYAVACSTAGDHPVAVTTGDDPFIRIWALDEPSAVGVVAAGHTGPVHGVACTMIDGRPVAVTAGDDRSVRLWHLDEASPHGIVLGEGDEGHTGPVRAVACTALDGRPVAVTGGDDAAVRLWDLAEQRVLTDTAHGHAGLLSGHTGPVRAVGCMALDGRPVAVTSGDDATVWVWDLTEQRARAVPFRVTTGPVHALACTIIHGRPFAILANRGHLVSMWDLERRTYEESIIIPDRAGALATDDAGRLILGFGHDVVVFDHHHRPPPVGRGGTPGGD